MARQGDDQAQVPDDLIDSGLPPSQAQKAATQQWKNPGPPAPQAPAPLAGLAKREIVVPLDKWGAVAPQDLDQSLRVAQWVVESHLVPVKTQAEAWLVMERGARLHFGGLAAFDFIYPVNGKARITPAGIKAVALASGLVEDFDLVLSGEGDARKATATVKRKGIPTPIVVEFSAAHAKKAGLSAKDNWVKFQDRMLSARANGYAWGDAFPDLTGGMPVREMYDRDEDEDARMAPPQEKDALLAEVVGGE